MKRALEKLRHISTGLGLAALIIAIAATMTAGISQAATDFDSSFQQLSGLVISGDDNTAGEFWISNGDGTYSVIDAGVGLGLWTYDSGTEELSPVTADAVLSIFNTTLCASFQSSSGNCVLISGGNSTTSASLQVSGDSDGPAVRLPAGTLWIEGKASDPSTLQEGEIFYNTTDHMLRFYDGTTTQDMAGGGGGGMTSFTLSADSGSDQTISNSNTLEVAGGTNGIDTSAGATDTVTINFDASEVGSVTWGTAPTWTFPTSVLFTTGFLAIGNGSTGGGSLKLAEDTDFGTNSYEFICTGPLTADMSIGLKYDATLNDGDVLTYHAGGSTWDTPATPFYQTIRDEGSDETQRAALNFIGDNVEIADDSGNDETEVTIRDWQDHMSSIGNGLNAINATDVTAGTSNTSYCVYVGTAVKSYTTCTVNVQVTTAVATSITWAEVAICTGDWVPNGNPSLTTRGSTSVTGTYNSLGTKSTTISLSGITPGDDIWFVWGSQATTPFVLRAIQDDISDLGLTGSSAATRPSTMGAGTTFTRSSTNNPARVVVGL